MSSLKKAKSAPKTRPRSCGCIWCRCSGLTGTNKAGKSEPCQRPEISFFVLGVLRVKLKAYSLVRMQYEGAWASWGFQTFSCEDNLMCDADTSKTPSYLLISLYIACCLVPPLFHCWKQFCFLLG